MRWLEGKGWGILNGCTNGDEEGEYTFTGGRGNTVIDLVLGDEKVRERIMSLRIGESIDSDHHPLEVEIEGGGRGRWKEQKKRNGGQGRRRWDKEGRKDFEEKIGHRDRKRVDVGPMGKAEQDKGGTERSGE